MRSSLSKHEVSIKKLMTLLLYIFFISGLIVPVAIINKIVFAVILLLSLLEMLHSKSFQVPIGSPFIIFIIFIYGFLFALNGNTDMALSVQLILSVVILFLIYPIQKYNIDLNKMIKVCGIVLVLTFFIYYMLVVNSYSFYGSDKLIEMFMKYSEASYGERVFFASPSLMVHLGTVPFLFLPACLFFQDYLKTKKIITLLAIITIIITMFFSTSRALIIGTFCGVIVLLCLNAKGIRKIVIIILMSIIIISAFNYISSNSVIFSADEVSNSVKIGHVNSFVSGLTIQGALFGNGLASYYYSEGSNAFRSQTEITVLDMSRYFGFILTFILYVSMIFPVPKLNLYRGRCKEAFLIFCIYLGMSTTNPILINSFGSIIILWYWNTIINNERGI